MNPHQLFIALVISVSTFGSLSAQLADGSIAPNFNLPDINGNTHNLYALLDSGYNVVIDFSAVWCPPCWSYHNSHALKNIYENYGPNGTNEVRVFYVEGDAGTLNQLNGIGGGTQGNWVSGTPYPIIQTITPAAAAVVSQYQITYFPNVYVICAQNKQVKVVDQMPYDELKDEIFSCPATRATDVMADYYSGSDYVCSAGGLVSNGQLNFINRGTNAITSMVLRAYQGGSLILTQPWSGSVASGATGTINLQNFNLNNIGNIRFELDLPSDQLASNNETEHTFSIANDATSLQIQIQIKADIYGSEIGWFLETEAGTPLQSIASGTYPNNVQQLYTYTQVLTDNNCYNFTITDDYGDGICCGQGNGYYLITDMGTGDTLLSGGQYTSEEYGKITTGIITDIKSNVPASTEISVYPNPNQGSFFIESPEMGLVSLQNTLGQELISIVKSKENIRIDASKLPAGMYWISIKNDHSFTQQPIQITK